MICRHDTTSALPVPDGYGRCGNAETGDNIDRTDTVEVPHYDVTVAARGDYNVPYTADGKRRYRSVVANKAEI